MLSLLATRLVSRAPLLGASSILRTTTPLFAFRSVTRTFATTPRIAYPPAGRPKAKATTTTTSKPKAKKSTKATASKSTKKKTTATKAKKAKPKAKAVKKVVKKPKVKKPESATSFLLFCLYLSLFGPGCGWRERVKMRRGLRSVPTYACATGEEQV